MSASLMPEIQGVNGGESTARRISARFSASFSGREPRRAIAEQGVTTSHRPRRQTDRREGTVAGATPAFWTLDRPKAFSLAYCSKGRSRHGSFFLTRRTSP